MNAMSKRTTEIKTSPLSSRGRLFFPGRFRLWRLAGKQSAVALHDALLEFRGHLRVVHLEDKSGLCNNSFFLGSACHEDKGGEWVPEHPVTYDL
jgi:hypothetical protein